MICSFFAAADVDEAEQRFVKRESSSKGCHLIGVLENARASQLMRESLHVVEYLDHNVVTRCVAVRIALCDMVPNLIMEFLGSVSTAISASLVKIIMELEGQKGSTIVRKCLLTMAPSPSIKTRTNPFASCLMSAPHSRSMVC